MEEIGRVHDYGNEPAIVRVEIEAKGACHNCASRRVCLPFGNDGRMMTEAINERGAQPGDVVRIEMSPKSTISAALLLYVFPVVALFLGYIFGLSTTGEEKYGIAAGVLLLAVSFVLLKVLNPTFSKGARFKPVIVEIIKKDDTAEPVK